MGARPERPVGGAEVEALPPGRHLDGPDTPGPGGNLEGGRDRGGPRASLRDHLRGGPALRSLVGQGPGRGSRRVLPRHPAAAADLLRLVRARRPDQLHLEPDRTAGGGLRADHVQRVGTRRSRARGDQRDPEGPVRGRLRGRLAPGPAHAAHPGTAGDHRDDARHRQPARRPAQGHRAGDTHRLRQPDVQGLDPAEPLHQRHPRGDRHRLHLHPPQPRPVRGCHRAGTAQPAPPDHRRGGGRRGRTGGTGAAPAAFRGSWPP
jgi:hypothetical protein